MKKHVTNRGHDIFLKALVFAADKHSGQLKKSCGKLPYINHPIKVASLLSSISPEKDIPLLVAALLHDVLEKTATEPASIRAAFGKEVLGIVREVTDDKSLPDPEKKQRQIASAGRLSPAAKKIRLADTICNMRDIMTCPLGWSQQRKLSYLEFAGKLAAELRGTDTRLERIFRREHAAAMRAVSAEESTCMPSR
jgi:GTP diphosphokinase / guanosine-3',5'-bis(diphosphate) 3'-diphosphatase